MSDQSLSTREAGPPRVFTLRTLASMAGVSLVATVVIFWLTFGTHGLEGIAGLAASMAWLPHLPRIGLLGAAPATVQLHVAGVSVALLVGMVLLAGVKGTALHKALGWTWVAAMAIAAVSSLFIHLVNRGGFSFLHLFAGWTLIALPVGLYAIRTRRVRLHARMMTGLFTGGLVAAGAFAFLPGRLMWRIFFG